jgi:ABC-type sugar transport system permease subunit
MTHTREEADPVRASADTATSAQRPTGVGLLSGTARSERPRGILFTTTLIVPTMLFFLVWVFLPAGYGAYLSMTDANLLVPPHFIGLQNYSTLVHSRDWWDTFVRTAVYAVEVVVPTLVLSFVLARLVTRSRRWRWLLMTIYFLPYVVPTVVSALVFSLLFQKYGLINNVLHLDIAWLADSRYALLAVSITTMWSMLGYYVIILMAGFQQIPADTVEAAHLDGAGTFQMIRHIELPALKPVLLFCTVGSTAAVMTNFGTPYVMTNGGPNNATLTIPLEIYNEAFKYSNAGVAEAEAMILLAVALVLALLQVRVLFKGGDA